MQLDTVVHILLIAWMAALGLLLVRMLWLGLHHQYLVFAISTGLDIVFGVATLQSGLASHAAESLGLLGDTMDIFLTPAIASELFGMGDRPATSSGRSLTSLVLMIVAAGAIILFLSSSPDTDSLQSAATVAFLADTMVTLLVLSFVVRRYRQNEMVDRNTLWLRRLFTFELVMSALHSLIAPFLAASQFNFVDIGFFSASMIATAICTFALRRAPSEAAKA
jgi:hypothetical protein